MLHTTVLLENTSSFAFAQTELLQVWRKVFQSAVMIVRVLWMPFLPVSNHYTVI